MLGAMLLSRLCLLGLCLPLACSPPPAAQGPAEAPVENAAARPRFRYFLAGEAQLDARFRGWLPALRAPRERRQPNPRTGEVVHILSWEPSGPWPADAARAPTLDDLPGEALSTAGPPLLAGLAEALGLGPRAQLEAALDAPARYPPPGVSGRLSRVPEPIVVALATQDEAQLAERHAMAFDGARAPPLHDTLRLGALARRAARQGLGLYVFDGARDARPRVLELELAQPSP